MKKIAVLLTVLILGAGLAFARSPAESSKAPTLVWWLIGQTPSNLQAGLKVISDYTESKIGVRLDIKVVGWADAGRRMRTIVNTSEYYDIMFVDLENYSSFVELGAFEDLTNLARTETPALYNFLPSLLWDGTKVNGKIYAVPTYKDSSKTRFLVWDDAYVKKYNLDITKIHTSAEIDRALRTIKQGEGRTFYPLKLSQGGWWDNIYADAYDSLLIGLPPVGVGVYDKNRKVVSVFEQPDVQEGLRYLHQWYVDGLINPDAAVYTDALKGRTVFHAIGWPAAVSVWQVTDGIAKYDVEKIFGPSYSTDSIQGSMNAISVNSKYKKEALKLLELVNTDHKLRDMLAFGIEGVNFQYVKPNVVRLLPPVDQWNLSRYQQGTFFNMSTVEGEPENAYDQVKAQNEQAVGAELLGFVFNSSAVANELANCKAVYENYRVELLTGASDPAVAVPKMMAELRAAGLQKIMDEAQRQVNAFRR